MTTPGATEAVTPERQHAIRLANLVLERPSNDPDGDLAVLARQFLRALEREANALRRENERCARLVGDVFKEGVAAIWQDIPKFIRSLLPKEAGSCVTAGAPRQE